LIAPLLLFLWAWAPGARPVGVPDPAPFDAVLAARARNGGFDYRGATGQDRKRLAAYLANLADARPGEMSADGRKTFYVNAYNAMAIGIVLDRFPVKSIRDVDGAFNKIRRRIGGQELSLDDIENRLRDFEDARIHFAIVCVSESCPPLAPAAYRAEAISADLDRQGRAFINDPKKNLIDRAKRRLVLSRIFDWNRKEFERDAGSIARFVARYVADSETASWLTSPAVPLPAFLEYDWSLNQR
jgi:hypothetical protein